MSPLRGNPLSLTPRSTSAKFLRFGILLVAACLGGAVLGLLTEPLGGAAKSSAAATGAGEKPSVEPNGPDKAMAATPPDAPTDRAARAEPTSLAAPSLFEPDLRGVWIAAAVLAGFVLLAVLLVRRGRLARPGNGAVHLVDTLHLGAGRMVHLVRCEDRKYLLANSERGISFLASVPELGLEPLASGDAAHATATATDDEPESGGEPSFAAAFARRAAR